MAIKENHDEMIRDYLKRFNAAALKVWDLNDEWAIQAFTTGIRHKYLKYALTDAHLQSCISFMRRRKNTRKPKK